jgi:hypothetical protein
MTTSRYSLGATSELLSDGRLRRNRRSGTYEVHVQIAKMHKRAEDNGKEHRVDQRVHEPVVELDKAPRRVEREYNDSGDQDWL